MTIQELKNFVAVCRYGTIYKAASKTFISQQALSHSIKKLENSLGHYLFFRDPRGVFLTDFGEQFFKKVVPIVDLFAELEKFSESYKEGKHSSIDLVLCTSNPVSFDVFLLASRFQKENSGVTINTVSQDIQNITDMEVLTRNQCDAVFTINKPELVDPRYFDIYLVKSSRFKVVVNKKNPLAEKSITQWSDLSNEAFFLFSEGSRYTDLVIGKCVSNGFYPIVSYRGSSLLDARRFVQSDSGISVVPDYAAGLYTAYVDNVVCLDFDTQIVLDFVFVIKKTSSQPPLLGEFMDYVKKNLLVTL